MSVPPFHLPTTLFASAANAHERWNRSGTPGMSPTARNFEAAGHRLVSCHEALAAIWSVRPDNWRDGDDPEQTVAWTLVERLVVDQLPILPPSVVLALTDGRDARTEELA